MYSTTTTRRYPSRRVSTDTVSLAGTETEATALVQHTRSRGNHIQIKTDIYQINQQEIQLQFSLFAHSSPLESGLERLVSGPKNLLTPYNPRQLSPTECANNSLFTILMGMISPLSQLHQAAPPQPSYHAYFTNHMLEFFLTNDLTTSNLIEFSSSVINTFAAGQEIIFGFSLNNNLITLGHLRLSTPSNAIALFEGVQGFDMSLTNHLGGFHASNIPNTDLPMIMTLLRTLIEGKEEIVFFAFARSPAKKRLLQLKE